MGEGGRAMISCRGLAIEKGGRPILENITVEIGQGEIFAFVGGDGTGKSALLEVFAGLDHPFRGEVRILGLDPYGASREDVRSLRLRVGYMFKDGALISNMTVYQNLALPLRYHLSLEGAALEKRVGAKLREYGLESYRNELPVNVPAGMRKLAGLARAVILGPEILVCDEPYEGLDAREEHTVLQVLTRVRDFQGAVLLALSDGTLATKVSDRVGFLEKSAVRIVPAAREEKP